MEVSSKLWWIFMFSGIKILEASDPAPVECNATVANSETEDLPQIIVRAEHLYASVTNGSPYSKGPNLVASVHLGGNVSSAFLKVMVTDSHLQTVTLAYNGTHVCSSAQLRLEVDKCWAASFTGCNNKTNACDSVCFLAQDFYKEQTLRLFRSEKASASIGTWSHADYVKLYSTPARSITCYHSNESYSRWDHQAVSFPNLTKTTCAVGERCRITTGKKSYSASFQTFVGCETDSNHFDGCEEGCSFQNYHDSPEGDREMWLHMCKYCCFEDLCNNPYKCKNLECDLSMVLTSPKSNAGSTSPKPNAGSTSPKPNAGSTSPKPNGGNVLYKSLWRHVTVWITCVILSLQGHVRS